MSRPILISVVMVVACSSKAERMSPLRAQLPATVDGHKPVVLEEKGGIIAMYAREPKAPTTKDNPFVRISIVPTSPSDREDGLAEGWHKAKPDDGTEAVVDREYHDHRAQLVSGRYDCGPTSFAKPIDPTRCSVNIALAVRLAGDRVLVVQKDPAANEAEVLALADTLDLSAIEAAAQK
jgi:hypothetical protein